MAGEWPIRTLEELQANEGKAIAIGPFGSKMKSDCYVASGVPVIRGTNISDTRVLDGEFVYVTEEKADELQSCCVFAGDLCFPHRGSIGEVGIVPDNGVKRYVLSSSVMKLTCNLEIADPNFLFYYFRSREGRHEILRFASTVGTPGIGQPLASLKQMRVPLPPLSEQKAIAEILGALDAKIELNRRMNETLESLARSLFKSWFVDFDPVRAKMDGRQPPNLPPATAALFPDSFEHQNGSLIPSGWRATRIGDQVTLQRGIDITKKQQRPGTVPVISSGGFSSFHDTAQQDGPGVVLGRKGVVGSVYFVDEPYWPHDTTLWVKDFRRNQPRFVYYFFQSIAGDIARMDVGSANPTLNRNHVHKVVVDWPPLEIQEAFEQFTKTLHAKATRNTRESETLAALHDTLLPRLLSGELRVADAQVAHG